MWHELVLHGIGGRTIAEAKERLTYDEWLSWVAYIKKRGSLNIGMRIEAGSALVSYAVARGNGAKVELRQFMPHADVPEDKPASIEDVFAMLKSKAKKKG